MGGTEALAFNGHLWSSGATMSAKPLHGPRLAVRLDARMVRQPGICFAALHPGHAGRDNGYGIGDCLLIDTARAVFAVADASERCPDASRRLLMRFFNALPPVGPPSPAALDRAVGAAFSAQPYIARSTFCCAALRHDGGAAIARICCGGDSLAIVAAGDHGEAAFRSAPDMAFAGRCPTPPAGIDIPVERPDTTVLLATDGWHDAALPVSTEALAAAVDHGAPLRFSRRAGGDDLGYIIVSPAAAATVPGAPAVILGGSTARETIGGRRRRSRGVTPTAWLRDTDWQRYREDIAAAGIHIISPGPVAGNAEVHP